MQKYYYPKIASSYSSQNHLIFDRFIPSAEVSRERRDTKIVLLGLTTTNSLGAEVSKLADTTSENETKDDFENAWEVTSSRGKSKADRVEFEPDSSSV